LHFLIAPLFLQRPYPLATNGVYSMGGNLGQFSFYVWVFFLSSLR